jgi:hypothetical protein
MPFRPPWMGGGAVFEAQRGLSLLKLLTSSREKSPHTGSGFFGSNGQLDANPGFAALIGLAGRVPSGTHDFPSQGGFQVRFFPTSRVFTRMRCTTLQNPVTGWVGRRMLGFWFGSRGPRFEATNDAVFGSRPTTRRARGRCLARQPRVASYEQLVSLLRHKIVQYEMNESMIRRFLFIVLRVALGLERPPRK